MLRIVAGALLLLGATGCQELLVEPAPRTAGLVISFAEIPAAPEGIAFGGVAEALDQADQVEVRLRRGETLAAEQLREFVSGGEETRLQIEVEVGGEAETFDLEIVLYAQGASLFQAARQVTLQANETTQAQVILEPIPTGIQITPENALMGALGAELQLSAVVVFATGDSIPGPEPNWSSQNPEVVAITEDGRATALNEGQAVVTAQWEEFTSSASLEVRQVAASVVVSPSTLTLVSGGTATLSVTLQDANGNRIPTSDRSVTWSSSDEGVALVDASGEVEAVAEGDATITAAVDGASGSASVTVTDATGTVAGQVVEGGTGEPVSGAVVELDGGETTTTGPDGSFELVAPVGVYTLRVTASGFASLEIPGVAVAADETTQIGTVELFSDAFEDIFGIWSYLEVVGVPGAEAPDFMVFQPPEFLWDVDDEGSCFLIDEANVEIQSIEGDLWTFRDLDDGEVFTYRIFLEEPDILRFDLQDDAFELSFRFGRTVLTLSDLEPRCGASGVGGGSPRGVFSSPATSSLLRLLGGR